MKLNLGSGDLLLDGYENLDGSRGDVIYPLPYEDGTVEEIRASHVLEHFSNKEIKAVLQDWVRVLTPGGVLKVAVPDFETVAKLYLAGAAIPVQGYVMGGQVDERDFHKVIFDRESLTDALRSVGLIRVRQWQSEVQDCAALPVSLNLEGTKGELPDIRIGAAMSVPRLGFMDNFFCAMQAFIPLKIGLRKQTGAFWGQCIERCFELWIEDGADYILSVDYDSVYTVDHVRELIRIARENPEIDAIAPIQSSRTKKLPMFTANGEDGKPRARMLREEFSGDYQFIDTAHFGLTLIKVSALKEMPKPWFHSKPSEDGGWNEGRTDDDIHFWRQWREKGKTLALANHVAIGHAELLITWPGQDLSPVLQHPSEFWEKGGPDGVWE